MTVAEPVVRRRRRQHVGYVAPPSVERLILHLGRADRRGVGARDVPRDGLLGAAAQRRRRRLRRDEERARCRAPATSLVSALPMPPPPGCPSRAVSRKFSVRSPAKPTQSAVGRNSEKQSRMASGTTAVGAAARPGSAR